MFYAREDTRYVWQESYNICVNMIMEAREVQRRLKKRVCKHKKTARWAQMENVVADRNAT